LPVAPETASSEEDDAFSLAQDVFPVPESVVLSGDAKGEQPSSNVEELNGGVEMSI